MDLVVMKMLSKLFYLNLTDSHDAGTTYSDGAEFTANRISIISS